MHTPSKPAPLWVNWLLAVSAGVALFGLLLVIAPDVARRGFSWMALGDPGRITAFGEQASNYIALVHAVLGGVMVGWGVALVLVVKSLLAVGSRLGWRIIAVSVATWFVPDTTYSLWSGFWQNAVLNVVFAVLFLVPLMATYRACHESGT